MPANPIIRVLRTLAENASANPLDVLKIKSALGVLGHYEAPEWGLSEFPEPALFKAIQNFQRQHSLQADGVMKPGGPTEDTLRLSLSRDQADTALYATARTLQDMGRNGDTILAHLTPVEAQLLHDITDGASINPPTGLLEFWHDYESEAYGVGDCDQNSGPDRGDNDSDSNDNPNDTRANPDGQDTLGGGNSLTAPATASTSVPDFAREETIDKPRTRTVLTPDNDPSFSAGFFDKKDTEKPPTTPSPKQMTQKNATVPETSMSPGVTPAEQVRNIEKAQKFTEK